MEKRNLLIGYRILFGLLGFSAIVTEIVTLVGRGTFVLSNFISFFTIESNLFAAFVLIFSALSRAGPKQSKLMAMLRGANTFNMILVGVLFTLLLSGSQDTEFTAVPWDNIVLHYIIPVAVAIDWFIDIPKVLITFKQALVWVLFPVVFLLYSLIRGQIVEWYPYPFLDPSNNSYTSIITTSFAIIFGATGLSWVLAKLTMKNATRNTRSSTH